MSAREWAYACFAWTSAAIGCGVGHEITGLTTLQIAGAALILPALASAFGCIAVGLDNSPSPSRR